MRCLPLGKDGMASAHRYGLGREPDSESSASTSQAASMTGLLLDALLLGGNWHGPERELLEPSEAELGAWP